MSHVEFEYLDYLEAISQVLTQVIHSTTDQTTSGITNDNSSHLCMPSIMNNGEEIEEDLNASYSDRSSNGGALPSHPPRMIKVLRRRHFLKGQGWTSVVIQPKPQTTKIIELIKEIKDK